MRYLTPLDPQQEPPREPYQEPPRETQREGSKESEAQALSQHELVDIATSEEKGLGKKFVPSKETIQTI